MKKYKIVENHSGVNGDYVVETYTNSFAQAVNILRKFDNPFGSDIKSSTLLMMSDNKYVEIGKLEYVTSVSIIDSLQELGETCTISLTSHSCLATNKQILFEDEIKQIKMFSEDAEVWNSLTTPPSDHVIISL